VHTSCSSSQNNQLASSSGSGGASAGSSSSGGGGSTGSSSSGGGGSTGSGGCSSGGAPTAGDVTAWAQAYKAAHPGNGGKDWDINTKTSAEIAADPALQQLLSICGKDQRPVIPILAWEYGGADHPWINPQASAVAYCVYTPVNPSTSDWSYDAAADHVTADVYVRFPAENPCKNEQGANQVASCIGDPTNFEIFVDIASLHDGADVGLLLANASTELKLVLCGGTKVHLANNL